jgi:endonuclease III
MSTKLTPCTPKKVNADIAELVTPEQPNARKSNTKKGKLVGPFRIVVQRKSSVKNLCDMDSSSSTLAAVNKYKSISNALWSRHPKAGFRTTILHHFGKCNVFRRCFEPHEEKSTSPYFDEESSMSLLEISVHKSVRHLCGNACFLRTYLPIREYSFLWRDFIIDDSYVGESGESRDDGDCVPTKAQVMNGWICQLIPPAYVSAIVPDVETETKKPAKVKVERSPSIIFVSSSGEEIDKRAKLEKHLNCLYKTSPESFQHTEATTTPQTNPLYEYVESINPLFSPLGLLEELFTNDPWKLLVSTILLNKTQRAQVDVIFFQFLQKWPDAVSTSMADPNEILEIIGPLGLGNKRSKSLVRFSKEYLELIAASSLNEDGLASAEFNFRMKDVLSLHQCGVYAWTAYQIFILKELPETDTFQVCDHALQLYVEYKLGVRLQRSLKSNRAHECSPNTRVSKRKADKATALDNSLEVPSRKKKKVKVEEKEVTKNESK